MLVLSRKKGESIMIGDDIELVLIEMAGDTVRIGIKAPEQVEILRKEVYEAIQTANREAAKQRWSPEQLQQWMETMESGKKRE